MRYGEGDRQSENVEDRRGDGGGGGMFPGGGMPIRIGGGGLSLGSLILIGIVCLLLGINPLTLLSDGGLQIPDMPRPERQGVPQNVPGMPGQPRVGDSNDEKARFVRWVLADTEDVWDKIFTGAGRRYEKPTLVMFSGATRTACGTGQSAMGPFYCPLDRKVYIDLSFYDDLRRRFHAPGDFAQAYVIAHEIGHHVQNLLGIADKVQALKQRASSEGQANHAAGEDGAAGRLLRRRVGLAHPSDEGPPAARRHRERAQRRRRHRRRPAAEAGAGLCGAGVASRTAPRRSACAGSSAATTPARRSSATRSTRRVCRRVGSGTHSVTAESAVLSAMSRGSKGIDVPMRLVT